MKQHPRKVGNHTYETQFGPRVSCNSQVYERSVNNTCYALRRLLGKRKPLIPGHCDSLYANQATFMTDPSLVETFSNYSTLIGTLTTEYTTALQEQQEHYADPHEKRAARINAFRNAYNEGMILHSHSCGVGRSCDHVDLSVKVETAKDGKIPRGVVDIGLNASLVVFRLALMLKEAVAATVFTLPGLEVHFIKTSSYADLKKGFDIMWKPTQRITMLVFSDDVAMVHVGDGGEITYYDLDISSCDKSHTQHLFNMVRVMTPPPLRADLELAMEQLRQPLRVRNPTDRREYFELIPLWETLYSGSVLTTIVNVVAGFACGVSYSRLTTINAATLHRASNQAGYDMTITPHKKFQKVQFLKHSPALDTSNQWQPALNMGVLLRASGHVKGDLPGIGPIRERALAQHAAQLSCSYPNSHFPLITEARRRHAVTTEAAMKVALKQAKSDPVGWPRLTFTDQAILERYDLTLEQAHGVQLFFNHASYQHVVATPDLDAILHQDYGMRCNPLLNPSPPYYHTHQPPI